MSTAKSSPGAKRPWQSIAAEAEAEREASLALVKPSLADLPLPNPLPLNVTHIPGQVLTDEELRITAMPPEQLLDVLARGEISAVTVTNAFLRRAAVAQRLANCITELLPEQALARAAFLDDHLARTGRTIGTLHGLPISVKEHIEIKGLRSDSAFICLWDHIAEEDAHCLKILEAAGAVFHARTTEPQLIMHLETRNNYYGTTVNPYQRELTAGGSSGGEGALVGLRGSCLGIGTDIGGSIRSPAANCGVYGLRPTSGRIPTNGSVLAHVGTENIVPVIGPISTSIEGIKLFMQTLIDAEPWMTEPYVLPLPWRRDLINHPWLNKLKIGVLWDDEVVKPHPPITRALKEVVAKLKGIPSVEVLDWNPYEQERAWSIAASLYFPDGGKEEEELINESGEPLLPLSKHIIKDNDYCKRFSMEELLLWQNKRETYREEYAQIWNDTATGPNYDGMMDAILCPVGPSAAPVLETSKWWGYTSQWNVLDYPAIVFPVTKCDAKVDIADQDYKPRNGMDEFIWKTYDSAKYNGVPVSLQLVCRRYEDEKLVGILDCIQRAIGLPFVAFP